MAKQFHIPEMYESPLIRTIKQARQATDPRKKDLSPALLDVGPIRFLIPRHFGFCYGVQNAIDIAYRTLDEAQGRPVYLLGEMIHNPIVNEDLQRRGIQFLFNTDGTERISLDTLTSNDIVIVPAFGTTLAIEEQLKSKGIDPYSYNTTCPFVEKVWKRGSQLGTKGYNLVIHGKASHEETRATFSHAQKDARAVVVVLNTNEAHILADCMLGRRTKDEFDQIFADKCTPGFDPQHDLVRFGVINQTTMLATETQEVITILREAAIQRFGTADIEEHVADTSDTLCYATNENQSATLALMEHKVDIALVVGGFNSSNTMHIVELLEKNYPTYHVRDISDLPSPNEITHFDQWTHTIRSTQHWLDTSKKPLNIVVTSGASCPDSMVDAILLRMMSWFDELRSLDEVIAPFKEQAGIN
jgi:4-hydroxy-3-methylbut-2-enyl diphosphate reductase